MKWVTRERPKIDRIACPWLVARFIDAKAEFLYVPSKDVLKTAEETGAIPYDVPREGCQASTGQNSGSAQGATDAGIAIPRSDCPGKQNYLRAAGMHSGHQRRE